MIETSRRLGVQRAGDDVMAAGVEWIRRISRALLKFGTTVRLATTVAARRNPWRLQQERL